VFPNWGFSRGVGAVWGRSDIPFLVSYCNSVMHYDVLNISSLAVRMLSEMYVVSYLDHASVGGDKAFVRGVWADWNVDTELANSLCWMPWPLDPLSRWRRSVKLESVSDHLASRSTCRTSLSFCSQED
jgi:hypothetical protein